MICEGCELAEKHDGEYPYLRAAMWPDGKWCHPDGRGRRECVKQDWTMTPAQRIRYDTGRLLTLMRMIDGRLKFPILVSRFPK